MNSSLRVGQSFGPYQIQSLLGEGGMAVVYRARHRLLGTEHAIKMLKTTTVDAERLLREGRVQSQIQHPNIVAVTDLVPQLGQLALVMEYIDGPSLETVLGQRSLTLAQTNQIAREILAGVSAVHAAGLVHRDLKPGNVLLALTSDGLVAKVADFGLVKGDDSLLQTASGAVMGTPAYMAPEQFLDAGQVDARADVFSLGAMLYHMVTAVRPFRAPSVLGVVDAIRMGRFMPIRERTPDCPEALADLIESALAPDRDARPATAVELLNLWCAAFPDDTPARWPTAELAAYAAAALPTPTPQGEMTLTAPGRLGRPPAESSENAHSTDSLDGQRRADGESGISVRWVASIVAALVVLGAALMWWMSPGEPEHARPMQPAASAHAGKPCAAPRYGGTVRVRTLFKSGRFTVYGANTLESYATRQMFESLGSGGADPLVTFELGADQMTAEVTLRAGVRFHSHPALKGNPEADAADLAWSIITRLSQTGDDGGLLGLDTWRPSPDSWPEGVDLVEPRTVRLRFGRPVPRLFSEIRLAWLMSHDLMMIEDPLGLSHPAGTGPFEWAGGEGAVVRLKRFEQYWHRSADGQALPFLDGVELHPADDVTHQIAQLHEGTFDLVQLNRTERDTVLTTDGDRPQLIEALAAPDIRVLQGRGRHVRVATLNLWGHLGSRDQLQNGIDARPAVEDARMRKALRNRAVRQALGMAIDRDAVAQILGTPFRPSTSFLPSNWLGSPSVQTTSAQPELARRILAEAGVEDLRLTLVNGLSSDVGAQVQSDLARIGVRVRFAQSNISQAVRLRLADGALGGMGSGPDLPADPYRHMRNMAMHAVRIAGEEPDIIKKLGHLAQAGARSEQTARAAAQLDRAVVTSGLTQPLAVGAGAYTSATWLVRPEVCNIAHPVSGQISHFAPTQWYLDRPNKRE